MNFSETIGIDVSKLSLDVACHCLKLHKVFTNSKAGFKQLFQWLNSKLDLEKSLFCFEDTGLYSMQLSTFLSQMKLNYSIISGLELKKSLGLDAARGKSDLEDSFMIAYYAYLRRDELELNRATHPLLLKLKHLLSLRDRMVKQRAAYIASIKEMKRILSVKENLLLFQSQERIKASLDKQIKRIEIELLDVIKSEDQFKQTFDLLRTVKGVGPILALNMIVVTHHFKHFDNSRKFASYCGVAPFKMQSGTSLNKRSRTSRYSNQQIKKLIHLSALVAIKCDPEIRAYYLRRTSEGKNKMSTINIVRNKLISRMFAVIKRQTAYVPLASYAA